MPKPRKSDNRTTLQSYPRLQESPFEDCLDDSTLVQHPVKIPLDQVKTFIKSAIVDADKKSGRVILSIPANASPEETEKKYQVAGRKLLDDFKKYCVDPAATAYDIRGKHYKRVGADLFRRKTLQKERMNAGWRYQYLALLCAQATQRFVSVSELTDKESDFNAVVRFVDKSQEHLSIFVSVKNRGNTIGGQDFPKAVRALEAMALTGKNRRGPYLCVFGIAMESGTRFIRRDKEGRAFSMNTEVWLSDFFWPFFTNYSYEEIMTLVLEVLQEEKDTSDHSATEVDAPDEVLEAFGAACRNAGLIDDQGIFTDAQKVVRFICNTQPRTPKKGKEAT
jgi:hypothetical protein